MLPVTRRPRPRARRPVVVVGEDHGHLAGGRLGPVREVGPDRAARRSLVGPAWRPRVVGADRRSVGTGRRTRSRRPRRSAQRAGRPRRSAVAGPAPRRAAGRAAAGLDRRLRLFGAEDAHALASRSIGARPDARSVPVLAPTSRSPHATAAVPRPAQTSRSSFSLWLQERRRSRRRPRGSASRAPSRSGRARPCRARRPSRAPRAPGGHGGGRCGPRPGPPRPGACTTFTRSLRRSSVSSGNMSRMTCAVVRRVDAEVAAAGSPSRSP